MHRSSESIAALAAALAKAQSELINPEKSLVGTIKSDTGNPTERLFRYASLASGLDIVRKTLGQYEIATVQTTAIDQTAGTINLTTVLAHASGQWIASDWPVCTIADSAEPHRMGAALTYARRYALFTLVGIAGEDDLDAPDLVTPSTASAKPKEGANARLNGDNQASPAHRPPMRRNGRNLSSLPTPMLAPDASVQLRDRLLSEIKDVGSSDDAALWAHRSLPEKNKLTAADARLVEGAFQARLAIFAEPARDISQTTEQSGPAPAEPNPERKHPKRGRRSKTIDKSFLTLPEPRRLRDRNHVQFVAKQACLICGRQPADAHHLRFAQSRALGRKVSDEFTVPLCRGHHREVHRCGDEAAWWTKTGIDPNAAARALWLETHPLTTGPDKNEVIARLAASASN